MHSSYEEAVSRSERSDVYRFYGELVRTYDLHGYTSRVHRITKRQLNRAANALADLIWEIARVGRQT